MTTALETLQQNILAAPALKAAAALEKAVAYLDDKRMCAPTQEAWDFANEQIVSLPSDATVEQIRAVAHKIEKHCVEVRLAMKEARLPVSWWRR